MSTLAETVDSKLEYLRKIAKNLQEVQIWRREEDSDTERKRDMEDMKAAEIIHKVIGGLNKPMNLLGFIVSVDKTIAQLSLPLRDDPSASKSMSNDLGSGIGFGSSTVKPHGLNSHTAFGLLTPNPTPPSANESRFGLLEPPATPTPASKNSQPNEASNQVVRYSLPVARNFAASSSAALPASRSSDKTKEVIVIYLTDTDDEELPLRKKAKTQIQNSVAVLEPTTVRESSPGIFDSGNEYTESEAPTDSRKRRRGEASKYPRVRSGATTMGDLLDRPGAKLSSRGLAFSKWSRLVYVPSKLLKFSVSFIWTCKENGELSTFNDITSPVGFYLSRKDRVFVPVIGHADKKDIHPEFVLEEAEIKYIQYNSEVALVCVTKKLRGYPDVLIEFTGRDDLWNFLVVSKNIMNVQIAENIGLKLPAEWKV